MPEVNASIPAVRHQIRRLLVAVGAALIADAPASAAETTCDDFYDNDGDAFLDCADVECGLDAACCGGAPVDSDGDGWCDAGDDCPPVADPSQGLPFGQMEVVGEVERMDAVATSDLDGDGDLDVLAAAYGVVGWYANLGSGSFGLPRPLSASTASPPKIVAADLDGDSDPDVLYPTGSGLAWLSNDGAGTFGPPLTIAAGWDQYLALVPSDLDADGDLDVLGSMWETPSVVSFENLGDGTFGPAIVVAVPAASTQAVAAADLDGDGLPDIVAVDWPALVWYPNLGGGAFGAAVAVDPAAYSSAVAAADVDDDGDVDVVTGIAVYGNEGGTFAPPVAYGPPSVSEIVLDDFDRDGLPDVALATATCFYVCSGVVSWAPNLGALAFGPTQFIGYTTEIGAFATGDVNLDGSADLLAAGNDHWLSGFGAVWLFPNGGPLPPDVDLDGICDVFDACSDGDDTLDIDGDQIPNACDDCLSLGDADSDGIADDCDGCPGTVDSDGDGIPNSCDHCAVEDQADADDDGVCDAADRCEGGPDTPDTDLDHVPDACDPCPFAPTGDTDQDGVCDDVDRCAGSDDQADGDKDGAPDACDDCLAVPDPGQGLPFAGMHVVDDVPGTPGSPAPGDHPSAVAVADLDGDGDLDLLGGAQDIDWYENEGDGTFGPATRIGPRSRAPVDVEPADLDGDGDVDVVSAGAYLEWYPNVGSGDFGGLSYIKTYDARSVAAADLDGDGDVDVVDAGFTGAEWFENLGNGVFEDVTPLGAGEQVVLADLDGDGDLDVVVTADTTGHVAWYANRGPAAGFSPETAIVDVPPGASDVLATDLDGNGALDVLFASAGDRSLSWLPGNGGGSFGARQVLDADVDGAVRMTASDVDGDGDVDVVVGSTHESEVGWYENLGGGEFAGRALVARDPGTPDAASVELAFGDVDGDADDDLVVATNIAYTEAVTHLAGIRWYENVFVRLDDCDGDGRCDADQPDADEDGSIDACDPDPSGTVPTTPTQTDPVGGKEHGCGCSTGGLPGGFGMLVLLAGVRRRRRGPCPAESYRRPAVAAQGERRPRTEEAPSGADRKF